MSPHEASAALLGEQIVGPASILLMAAGQIDLDELKLTRERLNRFDAIGFMVDPTMFRQSLDSQNYAATRQLVADLIRVVEILKPHAIRASAEGATR